MEVPESASIAPQENAFEPISMDVDSIEFDDCKLPKIILYDLFYIF